LAFTRQLAVKVDPKIEAVRADARLIEALVDSPGANRMQKPVSSTPIVLPGSVLQGSRRSL
jgi:hypothetical protein